LQNPVYLHTQPWSYRAVFLYIRQGFKIQKTDTFAGYENQYVQAMNTLAEVLPAERYEELENAVQGSS